MHFGTLFCLSLQSPKLDIWHQIKWLVSLVIADGLSNFKTQHAHFITLQGMEQHRKEESDSGQSKKTRGGEVLSYVVYVHNVTISCPVMGSVKLLKTVVVKGSKYACNMRHIMNPWGSLCLAGSSWLYHLCFLFSFWEMVPVAEVIKEVLSSTMHDVYLRKFLISWFKHILFRRKGLGATYSVTMPSKEEVFTKEPNYTHFQK